MNTPQTIEHDPEEIEALAITLRAEVSVRVSLECR
jgi:hypothetical protein